jgi:DNA-binding SARP family transcriptional activator
VLPSAGVPPLLRENETYRLNPDYPMSCDAWEVQRAFEQARLATDDAARRSALEGALTLARQAYLEGCYSDWAADAQSQVRDRLERAHLELGMLLDASGALEDALANYRAAAQFDAYRESTRAAIIDCLVRLGNRRAALVEWDRLKALLRDELGVDPLPETITRVTQALGTEPERGGTRIVEPIEPQRFTLTAQVPLKSHTAG